MYDDEMVEGETLEVQEDVIEETHDEPEIEQEEEVDWKSEAEKAKELAENYKKRAEKAEAKSKGTKPTVATGTLTPQDLLALSNAKIDADDLDEVLDYAKYKNVSIAKALKSSVVKATIAEKVEYRNSAAAVNTGATRRANSAGVSDDRLLAEAEKGILPESSDDIARLARLRLTRK